MLKIENLKKNGEVLITQEEVDALFNAVRETKGNIAEVGMFEGGSSQVICEAKGDRNFYGFETFEGIPMVLHAWRLGRFKSDEEFVRNRLSKYKNVFIHKGIFPETADVIKDKKFGLVHLDVDTYQYNNLALDFFFPRMEKSGQIVIHDYPNIRDIQRSVDEFISKNKDVELVITSPQQCKIRCKN